MIDGSAMLLPHISLLARNPRGSRSIPLGTQRMKTHVQEANDPRKRVNRLDIVTKEFPGVCSNTLKELLATVLSTDGEVPQVSKTFATYVFRNCLAAIEPNHHCQLVDKDIVPPNKQSEPAQDRGVQSSATRCGCHVGPFAAMMTLYGTRRNEGQHA